MKVNVVFGGGGESVLFSIKENEFFSYEQNSAVLHEKYGGRQYYTSRSGLSGAGFLAAPDDLIPFGFYRTDCTHEQRRETVHEIGGKPIFGYVPIRSHKGIDESMPFVLSDGYKVAFCHKHEVRETLLGWKGLKGKPCEEVCYDSAGRENCFGFSLYMSRYHTYRGVRATRFVDISIPQRAVEAVEEKLIGRSLFERKLNIIEFRNGEEIPPFWLHVSKDSYFDMKWTSNPRELVGEVAGGWSGLGEGFFFKRKGLQVEAFLEIEREKISNGKYTVAGVTGKWIEYEGNFSVLEWFSKPPEAWRKYFLAKITTKARKDYIYTCSDDAAEIKSVMEQNPEARISLQDSVASGNCEIGSKKFIEQYAIKVDGNNSCSMQELLDNDRFEEMLETFAFRKVIFSALIKWYEEGRGLPHNLMCDQIAAVINDKKEKK